jgi:hypothetical protein
LGPLVLRLLDRSSAATTPSAAGQRDDIHGERERE